MNIKSHTDLEQSKRLAEFLPIESADMCLTFVNNMWNPVWGKADDIYQLHKDNYEPDYTKDEYIDFDEYEPKVVPCWSLAALLNVLPQIGGIKPVLDLETNCLQYPSDIDLSITADNSVDACYEMVLKLHELNLL